MQSRAGPAAMARMVWGGEHLDGPDARAAGLLHDVASFAPRASANASEESECVLTLGLVHARRLAGSPLGALTATKRAANASALGGLPDAVATAKIHFRQAFAAGHAQANMRQILRHPSDA